MATGPALTVPGEAPGPGSRPGPSSAGPLSMFLRNRPRRGHRDPTAPYLLASLPISPRGASDPWGALKTERLLVWWSPERVARSLFSQWLRLCPLSPPSLTGLPQRPGATTPPPRHRCCPPWSAHTPHTAGLSMPTGPPDIGPEAAPETRLKGTCPRPTRTLGCRDGARGGQQEPERDPRSERLRRASAGLIAPWSGLPLLEPVATCHMAGQHGLQNPEGTLGQRTAPPGSRWVCWSVGGGGGVTRSRQGPSTTYSSHEPPVPQFPPVYGSSNGSPSQGGEGPMSQPVRSAQDRAWPIEHP